MPTREPLSAVLITLNAASSLERCLRSLAFVDDIVVVDSGSTDATKQMASDLGARVYDHPFAGFGPQKAFAVGQARHPWVLCVDADEWVPDALRHAIEEALVAPKARAYAMARANYFMGRYLRHGEGFPDWSLRLFNRDFAKWTDDDVHERVVTSETVLRLPRANYLAHHSADTLGHYIAKQNRYTELQADRLRQEQVRPSFGRLIVSPALRFVKFYVLRLGFLDGLAGFTHIAIGSFVSFLKYAKLIAMEKERP